MLKEYDNINYLATRVAVTCDSVEHVYSVMSNGKYEMGLAVHDNGDYSNGILVTLFHWEYTHDPDLHEIEKHNIRWLATNGDGTFYLMIYKPRKGRYFNFKGNRVYLARGTGCDSGEAAANLQQQP